MSTKIFGGDDAKAKGAVPFDWAQVSSKHAPHATPSAGLDIATHQQLRMRMEQIERDLEAQRRQAFEEGVRQGEASVRQHHSAQAEALLARLALTVQDLVGGRDKLRRQAETDVGRLSVAIARRILNREVSIDPEVLLGVVKAALQRIETRELFRLRVHPQHAAALSQGIERLGLPKRVEVCPDGSLEPGAAIFETEHGNLDASIETQLREIERGLGGLVKAHT